MIYIYVRSKGQNKQTKLTHRRREQTDSFQRAVGFGDCVNRLKSTNWALTSGLSWVGAIQQSERSPV